MKLHFPELAARIHQVNLKLEQNFQVKPDFGLFWNFCVNAPYEPDGIEEVLCHPHVDAMNGAIMVCVVLVYYVGKGA